MARILEISDDFNRADNASLGANWTEIEGDLAIASNAVTIGTAAGTAMHNTTLSTTDQYAELQITGGFTGSGTRPILYLRSDSAANNAYAFQFRADNDDILLYRKIGGAFGTVINNFGSVGTYANNDYIEAEVETVAGNPVCRAFVNGIQIGSDYTDTDGSKITSGSYVGIRDSTTNPTMDNFEAGILGSATTTSTTTSTSTSTSSSTSTTVAETTTSTTTTLASDGGLAFGEQTPLNGETAVSWSTWGGTGEVVGDPDWGKLGLDIGENGYSQVYDFGNENERTITITHNLYGTGQGTATTEIRGQATSFLATDGTPTWEAYSTPVAKTWRFIQVRLVKS